MSAREETEAEEHSRDPKFTLMTVRDGAVPPQTSSRLGPEPPSPVEGPFVGL